MRGLFTRPLRFAAAFVCLGWIVPVPTAHAERPVLVEFQHGDRIEPALRLVNEPHRTVMLARDGWLHDSAKESVVAVPQITASSFQPLSQLELRSRLQIEFGRAFEVVTTKHYVVVQPRGRGTRWAARFDRMHRQFVSYMEARGVAIRDGRFPLAAIVMPDEASMRDALTKLRIDIGRVAGIYDLGSNRVVLHETDEGVGMGETVRHEAAHQAAYNLGVHSRVSDTPRWLVEGIGSLFEPAIMENPRHGTLGQRVNRTLLQGLQSRYAGTPRLEEDVRRLILDDMMFQDADQMQIAYAVGWAITFYLAERQPRQFAAYLRHTSRLPPFERYDRGDRLRDFETVVDTDLERFSRRLEQFLATL